MADSRERQKDLAKEQEICFDQEREDNKKFCRATLIGTRTCSVDRLQCLAGADGRESRQVSLKLVGRKVVSSGKELYIVSVFQQKWSLRLYDNNDDDSALDK